jgi:hypothetical protein
MIAVRSSAETHVRLQADEDKYKPWRRLLSGQSPETVVFMETACSCLKPFLQPDVTNRQFTMNNEARLNSIQELSPYLKENVCHLHDNRQFVNAFRKIISLYSENHTKPINKQCDG